jgi:hypothetical protein
MKKKQKMKRTVFAEVGRMKTEAALGLFPIDGYVDSAASIPQILSVTNFDWPASIIHYNLINLSICGERNVERK